MTKKDKIMAAKQTDRQLSPIEQMAYQINFDTGALLGGLTVLAKDLMEYLTLRGYRGDAVDKFRNAFACVFDENRFYWECFHPDAYKRLEDATPPLPEGFAVRAANGDFNLFELTGRDKRIVLPEGYNHTPSADERARMDAREALLDREWLRYLGWEFFNKYCPEIKIPELADCQAIARVQGERPEDRLAILVQKAITQLGVQAQCWWFPLLVYMIALKMHQCEKQAKPIVN
jgi:hypothetical protein